MFGHGVKFVRDPIVWRRIFIAFMLLSGGAPYTGCGFGHAVLVDAIPPAFSGGDPPVKLPDPKFNAGATVTLRSPPLGAVKSTLFVRSGMFVPIDGNSSGTASEGTMAGQVYNHEHFTVPMFGGVAVPATAVGVPIANLSFEAFAGAQVKNRTMGFTWSGAGVPGGAVSASDNFTTVDPAIGAGIQYYLGTFNGIPTSLGANVTFDRVVNSHTVNGDFSSSLTYPVHNSAAATLGLNFDIPTK
jgi:hypothetical protein